MALPEFNTGVNQQLLDQTFGVGAVQAGQGGGEAALAYATPEQRAAYEAARRGYAGQEQYAPNQPYQTTQYSGGVSPVGVVEPFNQWQKDALSMAAAGPEARGYTKGAEQAFGQISPAIQAGGQALNPQSVMDLQKQYMNPYTSQVVDQTAEEMRRQAEIDRSQMRGLFGEGSFASSAHRVGEQELAGRTGQLIGQETGRLLSQGYDTSLGLAANQASADRDAQARMASQYSGLVGLGQEASQRNIAQTGQRADLLYGAGQAVQQQNQQLLDVVSGEIGKRRDYPYTQLAEQQQLMQPFSSTQSAGYGYDPSNLSKAGGAGMVAGGLYDQTGGFQALNGGIPIGGFAGATGISFGY